MKPASSVLANLRIATPCPMGWEQMTGNDRVRFCDQCQLNVFNLSELTPTEVEELIASSEGRICGRLYRRADGTVLTKDCPVGLRALRKRVSMKVAAMFAAIVGLSSSVLGQQPATDDSKNTCPSQTKITRSENKTAGSTVAGTLSDPAGAAIANAEVRLFNERDEAVAIVHTTNEGRFAIPSLLPGVYRVFIMAIYPYDSQELTNIRVEPNQVVNIDTVLPINTQPLTGIVSVIPYPAVEKTTPGTFVINQDMIRRLPLQ
jgi:hypothetical protein